MSIENVFLSIETQREICVCVCVYVCVLFMMRLLKFLVMLEISNEPLNNPGVITTRTNSLLTYYQAGLDFQFFKKNNWSLFLDGNFKYANEQIDNNKIFEMIAPAFNTIIGAFVGLLGGLSINKGTTPAKPEPTTEPEPEKADQNNESN